MHTNNRCNLLPRRAQVPACSRDLGGLPRGLQVGPGGPWLMIFCMYTYEQMGLHTSYTYDTYVTILMLKYDRVNYYVARLVVNSDQ